MNGGPNSKAVTVKTGHELEIMHQANQVVAGVLKLMQQEVKAGITTHYLDKIAEQYCRDHGAKPAFKGYRGFPASICASINEQVVHGIPSKKVRLREGDIISVDFGTYYKGFYGDAAITIPVGEISDEIRKLLRITELALHKGIEQAVVGKRVSDISRAIQNLAENEGYAVVKQFVGHGIGSSLHEAPEVPNYVQRQPSPRLLEGMVLAIEPMVNMGTGKVKVLRDQWTVVTEDGKPSAHFEHSVAITAEGPVILSKQPAEDT